MSVSKPFRAIEPAHCGACSKGIKKGEFARHWDEVLCHDACVPEDAEGEQTTVLVMRGHGDRPVAVPSDIVEISERPYRAYLKHQAGHSWEVVAVAENYPDWQAAKADVQRYMAEAASLITDFSRKQHLTETVNMLDTLRAAVWDKALEGNIAYVREAHGLVLSRAKLLRLDQDIRDEENEIAGRTVVIGSDEDSYTKGLEAASGE